jgi:pSer/pThr/pTyr-binding forkhead associated (FHA) protein
MAKLFFVGLDGTEKSYRLQTHRPFTVGRDPGNDIILRDPKVSRHHSEIVFERGFFVIHDLTSANGTFVNGKRVRVAPLTHGAKVRMGNTYGRFSEELPTENDAAPTDIEQPAHTGPFSEPFEPFEQPMPDAIASAPTVFPDDPFEQAPTSAHERINLAIAPDEALDPEELKKKAE